MFTVSPRPSSRTKLSRRRRPLGAAATAIALVLFCGASFAQPVSPTVAGAPGDASRPSAAPRPAVVEQRQPEYPAEALPKRLAGDVAVTVTIDATGAVTGTELFRGVAPELDRAAMETASRWRFRPAMRDGSATPPPHTSHPPHATTLPPSPAVFSSSFTSSLRRSPRFRRFPQRPRASLVASPLRRLRRQRPRSRRLRLLRRLSPPSPPPPAALDVTVLGRRPPPSRGASDFQIRVDQLADVPRANASDLLKLAPGILLSNDGGEGHAEQVFLRGFDAREGQDIEFTVGGVPINESGNLHGNGYADTNFIIPELVEGLRVLEGPFDPRQGNYAVAGSADFELGLAERGLSARYTTGSFGTQRILGLWGPPGESTHTFGGAEVYKTDGFGQNRDAQRGSAMGQYEGRFGASGTYRLTAQAYTTHFHSAGVVREDDYGSGRMSFYGSYDLLPTARDRGFQFAGGRRRCAAIPWRRTSRAQGAARFSRAALRHQSRHEPTLRTSRGSCSTFSSRSRRCTTNEATCS